MSNHNKHGAPVPLPSLPDLGERSKSLVTEEAKHSGPIKVMALRAGFYKCQRRVEGDIFSVESEAQVGTWMKKI